MNLCWHAMANICQVPHTETASLFHFGLTSIILLLFGQKPVCRYSNSDYSISGEIKQTFYAYCNTMQTLRDRVAKNLMESASARISGLCMINNTRLIPPKMFAQDIFHLRWRKNFQNPCDMPSSVTVYQISSRFRGWQVKWRFGPKAAIKMGHPKVWNKLDVDRLLSLNNLIPQMSEIHHILRISSINDSISKL